MLLALTDSFRRNSQLSERSYTRKPKIGGRYDRRRLRRTAGKMNSKTVEQLLKAGRVLGENAGLTGFKEVLRLDYHNSTQFITKQGVGSRIHYLHQIKWKPLQWFPSLTIIIRKVILPKLPLDYYFLFDNKTNVMLQKFRRERIFKFCLSRKIIN